MDSRACHFDDGLRPNRDTRSAERHGYANGDGDSDRHVDAVCVSTRDTYSAAIAA